MEKILVAVGVLIIGFIVARGAFYLPAESMLNCSLIASGSRYCDSNAFYLSWYTWTSMFAGLLFVVFLICTVGWEMNRRKEALIARHAKVRAAEEELKRRNQSAEAERVAKERAIQEERLRRESELEAQKLATEKEAILRATNALD